VSPGIAKLTTFEERNKYVIKEVMRMVTARLDSTFRQMIVNSPAMKIQRCEKTLSIMLFGLCLALFASSGCGVTAKPVTSSSAGLVDSYFGGPFPATVSDLANSRATFDHTANQIGVSAFVTNQTAQVPTAIIDGTYVAAGTGFLSITENFATTSSGVLRAQNPPLSGAWAVEIPGAGALANLLSVNNSGSALSVSAAPTAMAENTACPNFSNPAPFLYVTVPNTNLSHDSADYGKVTIGTQGSAVTFDAQPFLVGPVEQAASTVTGGCSNTNLGALTAYPLNSFGFASNLELISIGSSGLMVSSFAPGSSNDLGAFGGGSGVIGIAEPSGPVDVSAVISAKFNGFVYAPLNTVRENYDVTVLASAFGNHTATSQACSALQSSLVANNGQGAGTVAVLPSANSLYGGEFLATSTTGATNDPSGATGSEDCDVAIDLGTQDSTTNGLFPNAAVFIGSNYPPNSAANPWKCGGTGSTCAVSFPAAAVVAQVQGQYVIFVAASAGSSPPAGLPNQFGNRQAQPVGIYLFQKAQ
jgi:hypothetical protein